MKRQPLYTALGIVLISALSATLAIGQGISNPNAHAGKLKSVLCSGCHGHNGEGREQTSEQPAYPRLAGQVPGYFIKTIYDYKNDIRNDPLMNALSKGLTEDDIANLAAYYASLK
jgi:cytochrome c553